jgi:hypothetical protein
VLKSHFGAHLDLSGGVFLGLRKNLKLFSGAGASWRQIEQGVRFVIVDFRSGFSFRLFIDPMTDIHSEKCCHLQFCELGKAQIALAGKRRQARAAVICVWVAPMENLFYT